jgi:hypothetical protein
MLHAELKQIADKAGQTLTPYECDNGKQCVSVRYNRDAYDFGDLLAACPDTQTAANLFRGAEWESSSFLTVVIFSDILWDLTFS